MILFLELFGSLFSIKISYFVDPTAPFDSSSELVKAADAAINSRLEIFLVILFSIIKIRRPCTYKLKAVSYL